MAIGATGPMDQPVLGRHGQGWRCGILGAEVRVSGATATPAPKDDVYPGSASVQILEASTAMTQDFQSRARELLSRVVD